MHPDTHLVTQLQSLDTRIAALEKEVAALPKHIATIEKTLESHQRRLEADRAALSANQRDRKKLEGDIQIDDAYQGGEKAGKRGRGAANKLPFVIAVETRDGHPIHTQLRVVAGFTKDAIRDWAAANVAPGSTIISDGLACFNGVAEAGLDHVVRITGGGRPASGEFKWVNTGLGNVKGAITGTCRSIDARHTPRYLAAYEWRYNRRFDLPANLARLARVAVTIQPKPHREIAAVRPKRAAETPG